MSISTSGMIWFEVGRRKMFWRNTVPVNLPPRSSSESSPSSKTQHSTRSQHGSSIVNAISSMARIRKFSPTVSIPNFVMIWSAWRRSVLTVVFVTTGVSVFVDNTQRRLDAEVALLVFPRRRVVKHFREWDKTVRWSVGLRWTDALHMAFLLFWMKQALGVFYCI